MLEVLLEVLQIVGGVVAALIFLAIYDWTGGQF